MTQKKCEFPTTIEYCYKIYFFCPKNVDFSKTLAIIVGVVRNYK